MVAGDFVVRIDETPFYSDAYGYDVADGLCVGKIRKLGWFSLDIEFHGGPGEPGPMMSQSVRMKHLRLATDSEIEAWGGRW